MTCYTEKNHLSFTFSNCNYICDSLNNIMRIILCMMILMFQANFKVFLHYATRYISKKMPFVKAGFCKSSSISSLVFYMHFQKKKMDIK